MSNNNQQKKSKRRLEVPNLVVTPQERAATSKIVGRLLGKVPLERETNSSSPDSGSPEFSSPKLVSLPIDTPLEVQFDSLPISSSLPEIDPPKPSVNLMASLPDTDGWFKLWNQVVDHLYRQLTFAEQAVHIQLFRLSWGFGSPECLISLPQLAKRIGGAKGTVQTAIDGLIDKGLVRKLRTVQGKDRMQGIVYYVEPPPALLKAGRLPKSDSLPKFSTNKDIKDYKEIKKEGASALDSKNCPDCAGTNFTYPDGFEHGAKKCPHPKLKA